MNCYRGRKTRTVSRFSPIPWWGASLHSPPSTVPCFALEDTKVDWKVEELAESCRSKRQSLAALFTFLPFNCADTLRCLKIVTCFKKKNTKYTWICRPVFKLLNCLGVVFYLLDDLQKRVIVQLLRQMGLLWSHSSGSGQHKTLCPLPAFQGTQTQIPASSNLLSTSVSTVGATLVPQLLPSSSICLSVVFLVTIFQHKRMPQTE